jgi:hypothetical protein
LPRTGRGDRLRVGTDIDAGRAGGSDTQPEGPRHAGPVGRVSEEAEQTGREAADSPLFGALVTAGLIVYGGVHLVIAWMFLQVAWSPEGGSHDPIIAMSRTVLGQVALWAAAVGMGVLVLWRVAQVVLRPTADDRRQVHRKAVVWLFEAAIYTLIAISAVQAALTRGRQGSVRGEGESERSLGAALLAHWWGRGIVVAIGLALFALGIQLFRSAVTGSFASDLHEGASRPVRRAGAIGTFVKGIALVIIAGLLVWAAISYDPAKTGGLDALIQTLRGEPFGPALLTVMGGGLALFGLYCFAWSAHARR